jgi:hypothetical protein
MITPVRLSQVRWFILVILATQEAEIRRIKVQGQHGQKVSEAPISTNKLGMVVHLCNPNYTGDIGRRIVVQD